MWIPPGHALGDTLRDGVSTRLWDKDGQEDGVRDGEGFRTRPERVRELRKGLLLALLDLSTRRVIERSGSFVKYLYLIRCVVGALGSTGGRCFLPWP